MKTEKWKRFMFYNYFSKISYVPTPTYTYQHLPTPTYNYLHLPTPTYTYLDCQVSLGLDLNIGPLFFIWNCEPTKDVVVDSVIDSPL